MSTLEDLYVFYCRRRECKPNSSLSQYLREEYDRHMQHRVLECIDLSKNYVGRKGIIPVLDLVKNVKTVSRLDVSNNMLEHEQLDHLVYCLALHPFIQEVNFSNNCLHDGSLGHILKLLELNGSITSFCVAGNNMSPSSLTLIGEQLEENKKRRAERQGASSPTDAGPYYRAQLQGTLELDTSGGYTHFATWWKNPQYIMRTSKRARVRIVMVVSDAKVARQAGFLVFHSDGVHRVVEFGAGDVAAESTVDHSHCHVTMYVDAHAVYSIMPYTFYPQRAMSFTLTAELCQGDPTESDGWVTLDPVDPVLDWVVHTIDGEWTQSTAGGSARHHSWCRNPMMRLQYAGSTRACRVALPATILVKLVKSVDPDENDDRRIGFDVVTPDATGKDTPPIYCKDEYLKCRCPHEQCTIVSASFVLPSTALDLFVVPSTETPGELGTYTVNIFSSVPLTVTASTFPHGWNYRAVSGVWDMDNCGGSRDYSMSWKCNPSVALAFDTTQSPPDLTVFLEGRSPSSYSPHTAACDDTSIEPCIQTSDPSSAEEGKDEAALREFLHRHQVKQIEVCVSIVEATPPFYRALYSSEQSESSVARVSASSISEAFYLLLTTRYAGQLGNFTVYIFSSRPFVVDGIETLSLRERQLQLTRYAEETQARLTANATEAGMKPELEESEEIVIARNEILRKCMTTGEKYVDRDFPRGASSLWLDPEANAPADFPREIHWKRPTELNEDVVFLPQWNLDSPFPYSKRDWFASAAYAVATKRGWLQNVAVGYNTKEGMAQFRFFKEGKWIVVTIDDYLPFDNAMEFCMGRPAAAASAEKRDYAFPLMEKAYAKVHRCYEALERKVTPELDIIDVMSHGLMDLSGCITVDFPLSRDVRMTRVEQDDIWMKMKNAVKPDVLFTLLLHGGSAGASERNNMGILSDHLYPVLDARFIEGHRLVKLRHWGQTAEVNWGGKWHSASTRWTSTLRELLDVRDDDKETFWLDLDEVLFYFTHLMMTARTPNSCWVSADFSDSYVGCSGRLLGSVQFSLQLGEFPPDVKKLPITLGLHQMDPRTKVIRHKDALATYRTSIGWAIVATEDNTVWLKDLQEINVVRCMEPCKCRDTLCPLTVEMDNVTGKRRLTVVVFREESKFSSTPFLVSAWSESCSITLVPVERDNKTTISGVWPTDYPIGAPSSPFFWRDCPQYFIFPSESTEVSLFLYQDVSVGQLPRPVGFTVHRTMTCRSYLNFDPETVVLSVQAKASQSVGGNVRLLGMKERRGMPYVIVPFCTEANPGGGFHIEAIANRSLKLCSINPSLDWQRARQSVSFSLSDGSVGGSPRFSSWRSSPQFSLSFPVGCQGKLFVALTNNDTYDLMTEVGMMLLWGDNQWERGQRRKLVISPEDMLCRSEEKVGGVTMDCDVDVQPGCTLVLVVYASMPYREADVTVSLYSAAAVEVARVKEWQHVSMVEGSWELGYTAGGGAEEFGSWINNPFVALNTFRRTQIVALLLQYPRGPDKPIVKRAGNKKAFLPPVIINPHNRMEISLDLNVQDDELTPIVTAPYTRNSEVTLTALVPSAGPHPFLFVPHTKFPEGNGEFKLFVYADALIELFRVSKERMTYV